MSLGLRLADMPEVEGFSVAALVLAFIYPYMLIQARCWRRGGGAAGRQGCRGGMVAGLRGWGVVAGTWHESDWRGLRSILPPWFSCPWF